MSKLLRVVNLPTALHWSMNRLADLLEKKRKAKREAGNTETPKLAKHSRPEVSDAQITQVYSDLETCEMSNLHCNERI